MNPGFVEPRTEIWDGWSPTDLGRMVGQGEAFTAEAVPGTRMAIRHHGETMAIPFVAVFDAFVD